MNRQLITRLFNAAITPGFAFIILIAPVARAAGPTVTTLPASGITATTAKLNGNVNPNGLPTTAYFQYGPTTSYGSFSGTNTLAGSNITSPVTNLIAGLSPATTYHYRLVGDNRNTAGTGAITYGTDLTFTNPPGAPLVTTVAASSITPTNATLNGTVNPGGLATKAYFQYGLTTSYGSFTATNSLAAATNVTLAVSNLISSLSPGTTYHYQLVGTNSAGTTLGSDGSFTTAIAAPVVTTQPATSVTATNATLNGTVNPGNGATTAYFQYGLDTNYGDIGGFTVLPAANAILTMAGLVVSSLAGPAGATWTQTGAPGDNWTSIASSADGTRLAALEGNYLHSGIWTSTNGGGTWTKTSAPGDSWTSIASSADGTRLAAVDNGGQGIWTSTNGGVNWTQTTAPSFIYPSTLYSWTSIASSADGTKLAAVCNFGTGGIYTSTNSGAAWTLTSAPIANWQCIASSSDGMKLAAVVSGGGIYTSTNSGGTWTQTSAPGNSWTAIASSADGTKLVAVVGGGGIYTSTDSGATWTLTSATNTGWKSIVSSADGSHLAAVDNSPGGIWTSTNSGATWTPTSAPSNNWFSIASSADGTKLAAVVYGGGISTSTNSGALWTLTSATNANWQCIASSADGSLLAAGATGTTKGLYISAGMQSALSPGTTYHYRLVGINNVGSSLGGDQTFTTAPGAPTVTTLTASGVTATNATLNGTVNPGNGATTAYFQYGLTTSYGSFSATNSLAATNTTLSVSNLIASLSPGTTYHYQLVAANSGGTSFGTDLTFTTAPAAPAVVTQPATSVTATNATLNGTVNPGGGVTTAYFQYGLTTGYGSFSATNTLAATNATLSVSNLIASLSPGTTYHYRLVATNSAGTTLGADMTFTTSAVQPVGFTLTGANRLAGGAFQFGFSNVSGAGFTVFGSTNLAWPFNTWSNLGAAVESPAGSGNYQFIDTSATNKPMRFYQVRSP